MKRFLSQGILVLAVLISTTSVAVASSVTINGATYTNPNSSATYGGFIWPSDNSSDGGLNKINIVDWLLKGGGGDHIYTYTTEGTWLSSGAANVILTEIAGNAGSNTFGYYTQSGRNQIFDGGASAGASADFTLNPAQTFGFYLGVSGGTFYYTDNSLNSAMQAVIFQVDNTNKYIIGFEDLPYNSSDKDFQDMIVSATINPVPVPASLFLLGSGLLGLAAYRKKVVKK